MDLSADRRDEDTAVSSNNRRASPGNEIYPVTCSSASSSGAASFHPPGGAGNTSYPVTCSSADTHSFLLPGSSLQSPVFAPLPPKSSKNVAETIETRLLKLSATIPSSSTPDVAMPVVKICAMAKGTKYYISGRVGDVGGRKITYVVDSAADISVIPPSYVADLPTIPLSSSFRVDGFSGDSGVVVDHRVDMDIKFVPGVLKSSFYVCDASFPIIGTDLLQNKAHKLSLETGTNVFKVGPIVLRLKHTIQAAEKELVRRQKMGFHLYRLEFTRYVSSTAWMRSTFRVALQPLQYTIVPAYIDSTRPTTREHSFASFFDTRNADVDDVDIHVQSINYEDIPPRYLIPVGNRINDVVILPCDFVFGEVLNHPPDRTHRTGVDIFPLPEMLEEVKKRNEYEARFPGAFPFKGLSIH